MGRNKFHTLIIPLKYRNGEGDSSKTNLIPEREPGQRKKGENKKVGVQMFFQKLVPKDLPRNIV